MQGNRKEIINKEISHTVRIKKSPDGYDLVRATPGSAGWDIHSSMDSTIQPNEIKLVSTGISMELPYGMEAQVRSRSGMSLKGGFVLNAPGTIDGDYRGEVKVILTNFSQVPYEIKKGDRIAQLVFSTVPNIEIRYERNLSTTERNDSGFGSTGQ